MAPPEASAPRSVPRGPAIRAGFAAAGTAAAFAGVWLEFGPGIALMFVGAMAVAASVFGTLRADRQP